MPVSPKLFKNFWSFAEICFVALLLSPISSAWAESDEREGIVVWQIEAKSKAALRYTNSLSAYLATEVEKRSGMKVISDADVKMILQGVELRQRCGADGSVSCMAEIGAALGVPETVSGDLDRVGTYWILNLRRINVRKAEVIKRTSRKVKGGVEYLIDNMPEMAAELFGNDSGNFMMSTRSDDESGGGAVSSQAQSSGRSGYNIAGYATFFSGLAIAGVGGFAHWKMLDEKSTYEDSRAENSSAKDSFETWKTVNIAAYATGGALMLTGIVLWIVDPGPKANDENVIVGIAPQKNGIAVGFSKRW